MTPPNRHLPGQCRHIIRRTFHRQFLIRPDRRGRVANIIGYCYALAAQRHGIEIHAVMTMSNHMHLIVTDRNGYISRFLRDAHSWISAALNDLLGRSQAMWDDKRTTNVFLADTETVVEKVLYTWENPLAADLVEKLEQWKNFKIVASDWEKPMTFVRPKYFTQLPEEVTITPTAPPGFDKYDAETTRSHFNDLFSQVEMNHLIRRRKKGRKVLGMEKCFDVSPYATPKKSERGYGKIPRFAGHDSDILANLFACMRAFWREYRAAWNDLHAGLCAVFPAGTVGYCRLAGPLDRGDPHIPNYKTLTI